MENNYSNLISEPINKKIYSDLIGKNINGNIITAIDIEKAYEKFLVFTVNNIKHNRIYRTKPILHDNYKNIFNNYYVVFIKINNIISVYIGANYIIFDSTMLVYDLINGTIIYEK